MDLGARLQIRDGQRVAMRDAPADLVLELPGGTGVVAEPSQADVVITFVRDSSALAGPAVRDAVDAARADRLAWIAYPKAGQLGTDLNRDRLRQALTGAGVRPVRQVSIDSVWSALRLRPE